MPRGKKADGTSKKWKPMTLVTIYRMLRAGIPELDICKDLGISRQTYYNWQKYHPELKEVIALADKERSDSERIPDFVYQTLSPELKKVWDKIEDWSEETTGIAKIENMLQDEGKRVRQQLFLHALCMERFCPSKALKKVNITKKELDRWLAEDGDFAELCEEINWHKANFFEHALATLVFQGVPAAVIFANKTYNSSRGYAQKQEVSVSHSGSIMHGVLDLGELMSYLSEGSKLELLEAIRKRDKALEVLPRQLSSHEVLAERILDVAKET